MPICAAMLTATLLSGPVASPPDPAAPPVTVASKVDRTPAAQQRGAADHKLAPLPAPVGDVAAEEREAPSGPPEAAEGEYSSTPPTLKDAVPEEAPTLKDAPVLKDMAAEKKAAPGKKDAAPKDEAAPQVDPRTHDLVIKPVFAGAGKSPTQFVLPAPKGVQKARAVGGRVPHHRHRPGARGH